MKLLVKSFSVLFLIDSVLSHSFLECTDYRAPITGQDWNFDSCVGFPRDWSQQWNPNEAGCEFGNGCRKTHQPSSETNGDFCRFDFEGIDEQYNDRCPIATYVVGSTYRFVWPGKNHAADDECKGGKDHGLEIYVSTNPLANGQTTSDSTSDPTNINSMNLLIDWHEVARENGIVMDGSGVDGWGFSNCPKSCEETDNVPCYGDWTFTEDQWVNTFQQTEGYYTFVWLWRFQNVNQLYSTCFDAYVTNQGEITTPDDGVIGETDGSEIIVETPIPTPNPTPNPTPDPTAGGTAAPSPPTSPPTSNPTPNPTDGPTRQPTPSPVQQVYDFVIPLCYNNGSGYDENKLSDALDVVSGMTNGEVEFYINPIIENTVKNYWNGSVESYLFEDVNWVRFLFEIADNGTVCNIIENSFNDGGICKVCGGAIGRSHDAESNVEQKSGGKDDGSDTLVILLSIVAALLFCILIGGLGAFFYFRNKGTGGKNEQIGTSIATSTNAVQSNIVSDSPDRTDGPTNTLPGHTGHGYKTSMQSNSSVASAGSGGSRRSVPRPPPRPPVRY